ncbi:MAG: hypothetical protein HYX22_01090 [Candidatus Yanofskybacteria bacterium]|nr:hypothetical protein [Candidatus Yanofskybacteria bacterium]
MKKVVKTTYACEICDYEYDTAQRALECEEGGIAIPEFKQFEVVELVNLRPGEILRVESGFEFPFQPGLKAVIHDNATENANPHLLPQKYSLYFSTPRGRQLGSSVPREFLKRVRVKSGLTCPLCKSTAGPTQTKIAYDYLNYSPFLPFLSTVSAQKCTKCNVMFFTDAQSMKTESLLREKLRSNGRWPMADTRKLVREAAFQY